jgi:hypothetical protein
MKRLSPLCPSARARFRAATPTASPWRQKCSWLKPGQRPAGSPLTTVAVSTSERTDEKPSTTMASRIEPTCVCSP